MTDKVNAREIVLDMLIETIEGDKFSHRVLNHTLKRYQHLDKQERAFLSRIFTGTVKRYLTLDYIINQFASLKVLKMKPLIRNLLRLSVYQFLYMDSIPESAICNEAVKLAKKRGFTKLSGFVNGILRNIARNKMNIAYPDPSKDSIAYLQVTYSVPEWIVEQLLGQYGFEVTEILLASSQKEKETTIRCNQSKITPGELKDILLNEGVTVIDNEILDYAFQIKDYDYIDKLKAFHLGYFTVQDISSMLVCQVAGLKKEDYVIDVCAAPGGKALHAAEKSGKVSARDLTEYKIGLIEQNIIRLDLHNVETKIWDATVLDDANIGQADVVIADLPCSGLGVLGKKPDIKYKLTQNQQKELIDLQRKILSIAKDYVKPGGILIYSTCTLNKEENIENRDWFLKQYEFEPESLNPYLPNNLHYETTAQGYLQLVQGVHPTDGFFLSRMRRR
ncbi:16S rRNA (cytosine(967)-C(5))-methyltransferase RsmB [Mobilitalea sibirica]|uniref:16S rRNA (cytosine(967)-C(5))-methyltransferase n=1 Tax=Mobilitalea sibirica TaxID=1462919 RepID=A0A8J7KWG8_9FIRM|nr:16S rRNA (cytosine(967)-C(5))-methyltransferase RsmB [Mobilitalea sibirica]